MVVDGSAGDVLLLLENMHREFISDLPERAAAMERQLLQLEKNPLQKQSLAELFRLFHSLKGTAGSFGEHLLAKVCHQFENWLQAYAAGEVTANDLVSVGLDYIDFIRRTEKLAFQSEDSAALSDAAQRLPVMQQKPRLRILICDKSRVVRESVRMVFSGKNADYRFCDSGLVALETIVHEPLDLVITARQLNDLSGQALLAALRATDSPWKALPVIMIVNQITDAATDPKLAFVARDENFAQNLLSVTELLLKK